MNIYCDHVVANRRVAGGISPPASQIPDVTVYRHPARVIQLAARCAPTTSGQRALVSVV